MSSSESRRICSGSEKKRSCGDSPRKEEWGDIYEQEQPDGKFLKHIKFHFPVYFGDRETQELCWVNESTVETGVLMSKVNPNK